ALHKLRQTLPLNHWSRSKPSCASRNTPISIGFCSNAPATKNAPPSNSASASPRFIAKSPAKEKNKHEWKTANPSLLPFVFIGVYSWFPKTLRLRTRRRKRIPLQHFPKFPSRRYVRDAPLLLDARHHHLRNQPAIARHQQLAAFHHAFFFPRVQHHEPPLR